MQSKGSRIENQAVGLPEMRKAAHLVGPPSIAEFHAAIRRQRNARLAQKRAATQQGKASASTDVPHGPITSAKGRASDWWAQAASGGQV